MDLQSRIRGLQRVRELIGEALSLAESSDEVVIAGKLREIIAHIDQTIVGLG